MTMSDSEVKASNSGNGGQGIPNEKEFSSGQEVNKAKDPADEGGSLVKEPGEKCASEQNHAQANEQLLNQKNCRRGISFPNDSFVSGYCDPPDPWKGAPKCSYHEIIAAYKGSCEKHGTKPINKVIQQVEGFACNGKREEKLVLKNEKLDTKQCEPFEEILRRVQFKTIDLESCHLDDESAVAWFDMIEYYESTCHLNISFNKNIGVRGWQACSRLIRRTPCLSTLDLRNCDMNDRSIPIFGRALKLGSHLTVLHMENMYLSGRSLIILVAALKMNEILQELFLADNRLMPSDGIQLGNLLKYNHSLMLLDLRNNPLQDVGVGHICDGLYEQNLDKGLRTLVLWNNQITCQSMASLSRALGSTKCLETLNLGHNNVTNEGIHILKEGLLKSKSLMRLGLQSTKLTCEGAVALAEYVADSLHLLRLDLRENDIKTAGLMALSLALKVNKSVTRMDLDKETKKESGMKDYADQQRRLQQDIKGYLERNQRAVLEKEDRERQQLEERAQVEMAARASVQSVLNSAQEALQAHPEILHDPSENSRTRRPSLLFEAHCLTPQESLESPHCGDLHFFPTKKTAGEQVVVPALSVSSPPLSLDLPNPLTSTQTTVDPAASSDDGGLSLSIPTNPRTTALRSPTPELLLSPQYYPKPTARKIFSVSRVVEVSPASPSVSKTGVLDTGATGESHTPAIKLSSGKSDGGPSSISPTLLCQDLSAKTVNVFLQQIVSDSIPSDTEGSSGSAEHMEVERQMKELYLSSDPVEGGGSVEEEGEQSRVREEAFLQKTNQGAGSRGKEEEDGGCGELDPLGVMQASVSPLPAEERVSIKGCDSVKHSSGGSSQISGAGEPASGTARQNLSLGEEKLTRKNEQNGNNGDCETSGDISDTACANVVGADTQNIPVSTEDVADDDDDDDEDLFSSSAMILQSSSGVPASKEPLNNLTREMGRIKNQTVLSTENQGSSGKSATGALTGESQGSESLKTSLAEPKLSTFLNKKPEPALPDPAESPLFKTMEFTHFEINEEDLSLFGASSNKTAPASLPASSDSSSACLALAQGEQHVKQESSVRESSLGLGDTWLAVDAASLEADDKAGEEAEAGQKQPDFFSSFSMNGLTQELASALNSIDESGTGSMSQEMHNPDEFERELDAMLASVRNELPWPLQQDQSAEKDANKQPDSDDFRENQSTA